jgi:hypothetical protein
MQLRAMNSPAGAVCFGEAMTIGPEPKVVTLSLPRDVTMLLLRHFLSAAGIASFARVCSEWYAVASDPHLWQTLGTAGGFARGLKKLTMNKMVTLLKSPQFTLLKRLTIPESGSLKFTKSGFAGLADVAPNLEELDMISLHMVRCIGCCLIF